jgi:hypothetical protein
VDEVVPFLVDVTGADNLFVFDEAQAEGAVGVVVVEGVGVGLGYEPLSDCLCELGVDCIMLGCQGLAFKKINAFRVGTITAHAQVPGELPL